MMHSKGISLFAQMLQIFDRRQFAKIVQAYGGDKAAKGFNTWDQIVSMLFCHLVKAQSLREICGGLKSCLGKLSQLGMTRLPTRSNLSYANSHRPWQMYEQMFGQLLDKVHNAWQWKRKFRFKNKLYRFDWAKFRTTKGAVKLHLALDHDGYLQCFGLITEGIKHEVAVLKEGILHAFSFAKGSIIALTAPTMTTSSLPNGHVTRCILSPA